MNSRLLRPPHPLVFPPASTAPAFNVFNAESILGVLSATVASSHPIYLQTSASTVRCFSPHALAAMVHALLPASLRPLVRLHLDHCSDPDLIRACLDAGWSSVMIDASADPLASNVRRTSEIVALAKPYHALVEGEIGVVGGEEDGFESYGAPDAIPALHDVLRFIDDSGADLVAVGAGTRHGHYSDHPCSLHHHILEAVHLARPHTPLVLHGGTGIPLDDVARAVRSGGIRKLNISTAIKDAWLASQQAHLASPNPHRIIDSVQNSIAAVHESALTVIHFLSSIQ
jgi:ketose-bisphosphate aldolase